MQPRLQVFYSSKSPGIMHVSGKTTRCSVKRTLPAPWTHTTNGGSAFVNWVTPFTNLSARNNWTPSWKKSSIWRKQWWTASKKMSHHCIRVPTSTCRRNRSWVTEDHIYLKHYIDNLVDVWTGKVEYIMGLSSAVIDDKIKLTSVVGSDR